jgi:hypothetical protein
MTLPASAPISVQEVAVAEPAMRQQQQQQRKLAWTRLERA